jgi:hypothetical protein
VEELGLEALLPGDPLLEQRLAQTDASAELEDMSGRNPRLPQLPVQQQLQHVVAVGPVGLGATLAAAPGRRLGRVSQMRVVPRAGDLLAHEAPASRALEREVDNAALEASKPFAERLARYGRDLAPLERTRLEVERLEGAGGARPANLRFASGPPCSGLDITVHESDGRRARGHLSHEGPDVLRWALFEA